MSSSSLPDDRSGEPVLISHAVQTILVTLVTVQWVVLDDTAISAIVTAVGAVLAVIVALGARDRVTPVSSPPST